MVSQYNDFMLEIPASNGGEYREYLVSHETLQERPRLRLPVCGETAVPSLFQPTPRVLSILPSILPSLSLSFPSFSFLDLHLSITTSRERAAAGINRWKILLSRNPPPLHLFCFHLTCRDVLPRASNQVYLEYRCLYPGNGELSVCNLSQLAWKKVIS